MDSLDNGHPEEETVQESMPSTPTDIVDKIGDITEIKEDSTGNDQFVEKAATNVSETSTDNASIIDCAEFADTPSQNSSEAKSNSSHGLSQQPLESKDVNINVQFLENPCPTISIPRSELPKTIETSDTPQVWPNSSQEVPLGSSAFDTHRQDSMSEKESSDSISSDDDDPVVPAKTLESDEEVTEVAPVKHLKVKGEFTVDDLPPIEELQISIPDTVELVSVGKIVTIVESLVIIQGHENSSPLDEDTVLFRDGRKPFGKVFEIFGRVCSPFYSVRFNSEADIANTETKIGDQIYYAPRENESLTKYVFLQPLQHQRGSDASWSDNHEPPPQALDYSDDEEERRAKAKRRAKNRDHGDNEGNTTKEDTAAPNKPSRGRRGAGRGAYHQPQSFIRGPFSGQWSGASHPTPPHTQQPANQQSHPMTPWGQQIPYGQWGPAWGYQPTAMSTNDSQYYTTDSGDPITQNTFTDTRYMQN